MTKLRLLSVNFSVSEVNTNYGHRVREEEGIDP